MTLSRRSYCSLVASAALASQARAADKSPWLLGKVHKLPSEYRNQESGYFSIVPGLDGRLYIGAAKYGVKAYLVEFDPKTKKSRIVMDFHKAIGSTKTGFAAQAKLHRRNNAPWTLFKFTKDQLK